MIGGLVMTDYFKKTENILYNYPNYKNYIALKYLDIADMQKEGISRNSPSIVLYSGGVKQKRELKIAMDNDIKIKKMLEQTDKTAKIVNRIEMAINMCCTNDDSRKFIEMKYFENKSMDDICDALLISRSTAFRIRNNIINKLATILFGVDAVNY